MSKAHCFMCGVDAPPRKCNQTTYRGEMVRICPTCTKKVRRWVHGNPTAAREMRMRPERGGPMG